MRTLIEIGIIALSVFLIITFVNRNNNLESENNNLETENVMYKDSIKKIAEKLTIKEKINDSLKEREEQLSVQNEKQNREKRTIEKIYKDSLALIEKETLEDLVDDTGKIIKKGDSSFVLLSEREYREKERNELKLLKIESLHGICQKQMENQEELLKTKDLRIKNYKEQIAHHQRQSKMKDSIISNKDQQVSNKEKEIKKQKWITRGTAGAGLILLGIFAF